VSKNVKKIISNWLTMWINLFCKIRGSFGIMLLGIGPKGAEAISSNMDVHSVHPSVQPLMVPYGKTEGTSMCDEVRGLQPP
jgi:hypothetical protein